VQHADRVAAARREIDDLLAALAAGPLSAPVPTCEGWTAADLASHVGWFCTRWRDHLRGGGAEGAVGPKDVAAQAPDDDALRLAWLTKLRDELLAELQMTEADTPVWTWFAADQTAGFVARRCAHELAIHRYDAQSARGDDPGPAPIAPDLAVDGIDELFDALAPLGYAGAEVGRGQTLHLHGTDDPADLAPGTRAEWFVRLEPETVVVTREHAKGDLALRAGVSDLELLLYGRPPRGEVQRFGDETVLDAWLRAFRF
jgi:uncharacterized protein (TIGR03083 family)